MSNKVLFIVHVEQMFEHLFPNGDQYDFGAMIARHVEDNDYNKIIALDSEIDMGPIEAVKYVADEIWGWSWGYEPEMDMGDEDERWMIEASGHEWTWVPPEIRNGEFKDAEIFISGGHDYECLEDWRNVLDHVGLEYEEVKELIY